ncbi:MAG TPA: DNA polymerase III subunit epsilon [Bacteroidales bacterium]|nr:MAG: DNA polymerase III subunit epsilon [Bacteroidetes bacterium GWF2_33_38]OFY74022.1 MAG: DNA polymerase III subunit epsilon [Bacteroidetes bacterium RIFOXYA12_FULL_33_9]HBF87735.1 DNA polymerase III subunit epsilon [Bacteroidales bacterium]
MNLTLTKPIAFFDLETTGVNVASDRIVEISILKVHPNGNEDIKTIRINPEMHIPIQASEIHGIYDIDVANSPTFKDVAKELSKFIEGCDLAGYNSAKFDIPLLAEEFLRAEVDFDMSNRKHIDVQVIFHKKEQRTLIAAYQFYCNKPLDNAHSAEADIRATYDVLKSQLEKYEDLKNNVEFLDEFSTQSKTADLLGRIIFDEKGIEVFNFGKYKGQSVEAVFEKDQGYYAWMMNGDFPLYTKKVITAIKLRGFGK